MRSRLGSDSLLMCGNRLNFPYYHNENIGKNSENERKIILEILI